MYAIRSYYGCIDSLINQSHQHLEIIIIDDNMPGDTHRKNTKEIIEKYQKTNKIQYLETDGNQGAALTRNIGIHQAKGEYTTFLDDDDKYLKDKISVQLQYMTDNNLDRNNFV